ncbi:MAG: serine/threonine-protein phosphatase [Gammaproteobacteria bacterium]|jgi:serine/threonine protein phosphatase PrpC|nr:serine/threonine-protein phosphatase [Gammaproteobacteria bacterium]
MGLKPTAAELDRVTIIAATDMPEPAVLRFAGGEICYFTARAPDKETPNEDSLGLIPWGGNGGVLVVCDGLGGQPSGADASRTAVRCLADSIAATPPGNGGLREAILDGIEKANRRVAGLGVGAATTLVLLEIQGALVRPYHVGDSMILVSGQRGRIKLQTVSHSPVGYAVEAGFLDEQEAMHHEERHLISNMIGTPDMRIEIGTAVELARRDTALLASDGLFDNLHLDEIVERMRCGPINKGANALRLDSLARMTGIASGMPSKPDDLSFILYRPA